MANDQTPQFPSYYQQHQHDRQQPSYYELKSRAVPHYPDPPTFKTLTPTSRTQLKQQLMREQQLTQDQSLNRKGNRADSEDVPAVGPLSAPTLIVPPQVLQVRTALENPTRYHVIRKQQSQVRQYLSESFQPRRECALSAPEVAAARAPSPERELLSPELCSATTTSNSETDDFLDDILSLESGAMGSGADLDFDLDLAGDVKRESLPLSDAEMHAMAKDRQKKDNHNMIERRRRFNINDRIKELGTLLPKTDDPFYEVIRDVRPNKGTILKSSVDYIKRLREEVDKLRRGEVRRRQTELHNRKLLLRVRELERQARMHGLPLPDCETHPYSAPADPVPQPQPCSDSVRLGLDRFLESSLPADFLDSRLPLPGVETQALNLTQMEDLMDDDPHNPVVQGDPMLCSSPTSRLRLESMLSEFSLKEASCLDPSNLLGPPTRGGPRLDCFSDADMELGA